MLDASGAGSLTQVVSPWHASMNTATLISAIAPVIFGVLALLSRQHNNSLVTFLILWFAASTAQILWAFSIQRRNANLARGCVGICVTQVAVFFFLFLRHLLPPD
jgi:hypothetical protein